MTVFDTSIEVVGLDDIGFGPQRINTRREWREICLQNLLLGKDHFSDWQKSLNVEYPHVNEQQQNVRKVLPDGSVLVTTMLLSGPCPLDFSGLDLTSLTTLKDYRFDLWTNFSYAQFSFFALIDSSFIRSVHFEGATFTRIGRFYGCQFLGLANFTNAVFEGHCDFEKAVFSQQAYFTRVSFQSKTNFSYVKFKGDADFCGSQFKNITEFVNAEFCERCEFQSALKNTFRAEAQTTFLENADFENAVFKKVGHFEGVHYASRIPSFLGVDIATTWLEFSDDSHFSKRDRSQNAVNRLGHLKRLADEHG